MSPLDDLRRHGVAIDGGWWVPKNPAPEDDTTALDFLLWAHRYHRERDPVKPGLVEKLLAEHAPSLYGDCPICARQGLRRWRGCDMWRIADRAKALLDLSKCEMDSGSRPSATLQRRSALLQLDSNQ